MCFLGRFYIWMKKTRNSRNGWKSKLKLFFILKSSAFEPRSQRSTPKNDPSSPAKKLSKICLNLAEFLEYTYLAVFGWFLGPMYLNLFWIASLRPRFKCASFEYKEAYFSDRTPSVPALPTISGISVFFQSSLYIKRTQKTNGDF